MTHWQHVADRFIDPKFVIAVIVLSLFGWALGVDPDDATMKGALIAGFAGAWGYYLGSSNAASQQREATTKALDLATLHAPPKKEADIELRPGETATVEGTK